MGSKKKKKSGKIKEVLSPEEQMDRLLGVPKARKPPKRPKSPDMDPADIAAEAARAAGAEAARAAAAAAAAKAIEPLKPGDPVEVHGLQSANGKALNGKKGVIKRFDETKGRYLVELGQATLQSLKPDNLRRTGGLESAGGGTSFHADGYTGPSAGYTML